MLSIKKIMYCPWMMSFWVIFCFYYCQISNLTSFLCVAKRSEKSRWHLTTTLLSVILSWVLIFRWKYLLSLWQFKSLQDYESLDREQINASRTCQQLKSNIKQLEQARSRLEAQDLDKFDQRISEIRMQAITSVVEFLDHHGCVTENVVTSGTKAEQAGNYL